MVVDGMRYRANHKGEGGGHNEDWVLRRSCSSKCEHLRDEGGGEKAP